MEPATIPLAKVIAALRAELQEAQSEGAGEALRFEVGDVELELQVVVTAEVAAKGGLKVHIFSIGGSAKYKQAETQKVKLKLSAKTNGGPTTVSDAIPRPK